MASFDPSERQPVAAGNSPTGSISRNFLESKLQRFLTAYPPLIEQLRKHARALQDHCLDSHKSRLHAELVNASRTIKRGQSIQEDFRQVCQQIPVELLEKYESRLSENTESLQESIEVLTEVCLAIGRSRSLAAEPPSTLDRSSTGASSANGIARHSGAASSSSANGSRSPPAATSSLTSSGRSVVASSSGSLQFFYSEDSGESSMDGEEMPLQVTAAASASLTTTMPAVREEDWNELMRDTMELNELMHAFATSVQEQRQFVDSIASHVDDSAVAVREGAVDLGLAAKLKAAMLPVVCGTAGAIIAGPVGLIAGFKLGAVAAAGAAGVGGVILGRKLKDRKQAQINEEMKTLSAS